VAEDANSTRHVLEEPRPKLSDALLKWRALLVRKTCPDGGGLTEAEEREFWELAAYALWLMGDRRDASARALAGPRARSADAQLLNWIGMTILDALDGRLPIAWQLGARETTNPRLSLGTEVAIRTASAYYTCVKEGLFKDSSCNNFLREAYGVSDRCIVQWSRRDPQEIGSMFRAAILKVEGPPEELSDLRREAGRRRVAWMARLYRTRDQSTKRRTPRNPSPPNFGAKSEGS
jgi:hypothetical protein